MTASDQHAPTILCLASFFKGNDFIRECKRQGTPVVLLTREKLLNEDWARDSLTDLVAIPGKTGVQPYLEAACYIAQHQRIFKVVALEEYDIVTSAHIREHLCIPGMGTTIARHFQDKLAMRVKARDENLPQPEFVHLSNYEAVDEFMKRASPPWMLKPRIGASSMGIRKLNEPEEVWRTINELNSREAFHERASFHLLEQYQSGDVYHVDSLVEGGKILFSSVEQYVEPPFDVAHGGGVSLSQTIRYDSKERRRLLALNRELLARFGFVRGVTHAEFIRFRSHEQGSDLDDQICFLEVAARVGGAYTVETLEAASGLNFWREWAKIEVATPERPYVLPPIRREYGGIAVSLARQEYPDTSDYNDPEIVYRIHKFRHVGLIVRSPHYKRVTELLGQYEKRFLKDFTAVVPAEQMPEQHL